MNNPSNIQKVAEHDHGKPLVKSEHNQPAKVSSELSNFLADIEDLVKQTTTLTGDELARARAKLQSRIETAKASAVAMGDTVVQKAKHSASVTNEYVHEQPWKAVATGTVIGFLFGALITRRN